MTDITAHWEWNRNNKEWVAKIYDIEVAVRKINKGYMPFYSTCRILISAFNPHYKTPKQAKQAALDYATKVFNNRQGGVDKWMTYYQKTQESGFTIQSYCR